MTKSADPCTIAAGRLSVVPPGVFQPAHDPEGLLVLCHMPLSVPLTTKCSVPEESCVSDGDAMVEPPTHDQPDHAPEDNIIVLYHIPSSEPRTTAERKLLSLTIAGVS